MSMRDYSVSGYGIILNGLLDTDALDELAENDIISTQFEFTGEAVSLREDGSEDWSDSVAYDSEGLYFIEVPRYPNYFNAAYSNMDELVGSMKRRYDSARRGSISYDRQLRVDGGSPEPWSLILPKLSKTEIRKKLRSFTGTYYG